PWGAAGPKGDCHPLLSTLSCNVGLRSLWMLSENPVNSVAKSFVGAGGRCSPRPPLDFESAKNQCLLSVEPGPMEGNAPFLDVMCTFRGPNQLMLTLVNTGPRMVIWRRQLDCRSKMAKPSWMLNREYLPESSVR